MPSRQDQLHSYQYSLQRVVAALVTHDPDPARSPLRRAGTTALVSILIASIAVGGAALYGLFTGQSSAKVTDDTVVFQEKGTGAQFVFTTTDNLLHPVLNYTSGLLLSNGSTPSLKILASDKLASVSRGVTLGIPDAPSSLPSKKELVTGPWSICTDSNSQSHGAESTLLVGDQVAKGTVLATKGTSLLVQDTEQDPVRGQETTVTWVVSGSRKFKIPTDVAPGYVDKVNRAFSNGGQAGVWPVSPAWINAIPSGPDLRPPALHLGSAQQFRGHAVGELVKNAGDGFGVIMSDGLAVITHTQAQLLQAAGADDPVTINDFGSLPASQQQVSDSGSSNGLPAAMPLLQTQPPTQACLTLPSNGQGVIRLDPSDVTGTKVVGSASAKGSVKADLVDVPRGKGAVVVSAASDTAPASTGTVGIVTDSGRLYTLGDRSLLAKLGYGGVTPYQIPSALLTLIPNGPALSIDAARAEHPTS